MKTLNVIFLGWLCVLAALAASAAAAEVRPLEFVHALEEKGYHDIAVDYLNWLKQQPSMPPDVAAVWDLEMSKSLRGSASRALNPQDFEELMNAAQSHLDKFLKEHPKHPEAVTAMVSSGTFSIDRALQHLRAAKATTDKEEQARRRAEARKLLDQARSPLKQAVGVLEKRLVATPIPQVRQGRRPDRATRAALAHRSAIVQNLLNARFQAAMTDYYSAQTYDDPKAQARKALLKSAATQLDDIYQANRVTAAGQVNVIGLYAHMWHGKIADEMGDLQLADDIYQEVLANDPGPSPSTSDKVLDPLFAQVQQFEFAIEARQDRDTFLRDATTWLKQYSRKSGHTEGYQGVALEVVKAWLDLAARAAGMQRNKLISEAVALLNEIVRVPSPYQQEALNLLRKFSKVEAGKLRDAKTFEEAAAIAESAANAGQWTEAVEGFKLALEKAASAATKNAHQIAQLRAALANAKLNVAGKLYDDNKMEECLAAAGKIIEEDRQSAAAEKAGSLAVQATLSLFGAAIQAHDREKQQAAFERLGKVCKMVQETWPNRPAADDAHMAMAQADLFVGKIDHALEVFEKVNPKSERYPLALYLSGRTYYSLYRQEKAKGEGADKEKVKDLRAKALERAADSLAGFRKAAEPGKPLSPQHIESQLLMAVMRLDAREFKEAAALVQPLVDQVRAARPQALDDTTVRIFRAALEAYLGAGDVARATEVGTVLADLGADTQPINAILVEFARVLDGERKKAEAEATRANASGDAKAAEAAGAKLKSTQALIGAMLKKLAARKEHSVAGLVSVGDLCASVGLAGEAKELYKRVLDLPIPDAQADPARARLVKQARTRAQAQLIDLLRAAGDFDEAIKQARQLAAEYSRALEPQMVLGRCLQARAEKDPAKYDEAINQWTRLRSILQNFKKKPPEYFDVVYNAAWCLYAQAYQTQEKIPERCTQAIGLLKSTMILHEKLSGPDMVEKYKALVDTIEKFAQQNSGAAAAGAAPAAGNK